jgi:hypothetical protein
MDCRLAKPLMPNTRKTAKPKVQIDADWLLGPEPNATAPRSRSWKSFVAFLALCSCVGAIACFWETWSQQLLRWQWEQWLASEETDEDTLAALVSLGDLVDNSTVLLIEQLQSSHPTRQAVAFQVLKTRCETLSFRNMDDHRQQEIVAAIEQLDPKDPDGIRMRSWIAARVMGLLATSPTANVALRDRLSVLLSADGDADQSPILANRTSVLLRGTSLAKPAQAIVAKPTTPPFPTRETPLPAIPPNQLREEPISQPQPETLPTQPAGPSREPTRIRIASEANIRTISAPQSARLSDSDQATFHIQARPDRSIEELLNALENDSDDQVAGIVEELQAKGFGETHVELAMALARGTTTDRLSALDTLTQDAAIQPIAWLVWVAESRDQAARMKAIAMLGSTADAEAIRHLQRIQQRESDPRIAAQIRQALVATQAASPKTR